MTPNEYGDYVQWEDYERITAAQAAEIERLRAEVEAVWAAMPRDARYLDPPDGGCVPLHEQVRRMAADATRAERLAEALRWALPLVSQGLEMYRLERLRCGHGDITGTYKNGETWAGIHQEVVDGMERARAALRDHGQEGKDAT